jgi:hypothetical protein
MTKYQKLITVVVVVLAVFLGYMKYSHAQTPAAATTSSVNFTGVDFGADLDALHADNTSVSTKTKFDFGYAGRVGYGQQLANGYFLGVEGSEGTNEGVTRNPGVKDTTGDVLTVDGRAGKVLGETLVYGKVGYSLANVSEKNMYDNAKNSYNFSGYRVGGGIEHYLAKNITGRVDVVYTGYGAQTLDGNSVDPSNLKSTVGVSYKLN